MNRTGIMAVAAIGSILAGGVTGGLLMRADVPPAIAHGTGFFLGSLLAYPAFRSYAGPAVPPFRRWLLIWGASAALGYLVLYPLVMRIL